MNLPKTQAKETLVKEQVDKPKNSQDIISKEETMFKRGSDGDIMPERFEIEIYNRSLDQELIQESIMLMELIKKSNAWKKTFNDAKLKRDQEIEQLKNKIKNCKDDKELVKLNLDLSRQERSVPEELIKVEFNLNTVEEALLESQQIIRDLKNLIDKDKRTSFVELKPCNCSESINAFEKRKTVEGKETDDWVSDLISKKVSNPSYTLEEAKDLRPDYKIALKESIMKASNYSVQSYRDVVLQKKLESERPLTLKKD